MRTSPRNGVVSAVVVTLSLLGSVALHGQQLSAAEKAALLIQKQSGPQGAVDTPSVFVHCVFGNTAVLHNLGFLQQGWQVRIELQSSFDPAAMVLAMRIGFDSPAPNLTQTQVFADDDSGGNLEPLITFTTPFDGSYTLHVGDGALTSTPQGGCYTYQITLVAPATT